MVNPRLHAEGNLLKPIRGHTSGCNRHGRTQQEPVESCDTPRIDF